MSIQTVVPEQYDSQLNDKVEQLSVQLRNHFSHLSLPDIERFESPKSHYRMRAEFKLWHDGDICYHVMHKPGDYKTRYRVDTFPVACELINQLMPKLIEQLHNSEMLKRKVFQVEYLTTTTGQAVISLIYHKVLKEEWQAAATQLASDLGVSIIGRSRKQKVIVGEDFVEETLQVNGRDYHYQQVETGFTQPNAKVCEKMLSWAQTASEDLSGDLLELYCGNGNFTLPLAQQFDRVLATEISKTSVNSALYNLDKNKVDNVTIVRMSSEEFSEAMDGVRPFRRLKDIDLPSYNFSTIFVDPPRSGLDDHTVEIVKGFDNIIYVSCNPETLIHNLKSISKTHSIERFAVFDQFPYTHHLECGVILRRLATS